MKLHSVLHILYVHCTGSLAIFCYEGTFLVIIYSKLFPHNVLYLLSEHYLYCIKMCFGFVLNITGVRDFYPY